MKVVSKAMANLHIQRADIVEACRDLHFLEQDSRDPDVILGLPDHTHEELYFNGEETDLIKTFSTHAKICQSSKLIVFDVQCNSKEFQVPCSKSIIACPIRLLESRLNRYLSELDEDSNSVPYADWSTGMRHFIDSSSHYWSTCDTTAVQGWVIATLHTVVEEDLVR